MLPVVRVLLMVRVLPVVRVLLLPVGRVLLMVRVLPVVRVLLLPMGRVLQAMWYTTERMEEGPVFGSKDKWHGLGVFFDSFDNDNKRNNPYVSGMVNDGTITYDHER